MHPAKKTFFFFFFFLTLNLWHFRQESKNHESRIGLKDLGTLSEYCTEVNFFSRNERTYLNKTLKKTRNTDENKCSSNTVYKYSISFLHPCEWSIDFILTIVWHWKLFQLENTKRKWKCFSGNSYMAMHEYAFVEPCIWIYSYFSQTT